MSPTAETELPPGRELDTLVAERVMGWTVNRADGRHWHTVGPTGRERGILIGCDCCADKYDRAFTPSQDIRDAWEVVEKLTTTTKQWFRFEQSSVTYCATFETSGTGECDGEWTSEAETAPLAICRAALKAVGGA